MISVKRVVRAAIKSHIKSVVTSAHTAAARYQVPDMTLCRTKQFGIRYRTEAAYLLAVGICLVLCKGYSTYVRFGNMRELDTRTAPGSDDDDDNHFDGDGDGNGDGDSNGDGYDRDDNIQEDFPWWSFPFPKSCKIPLTSSRSKSSCSKVPQR